jgi:hypothetical protein
MRIRALLVVAVVTLPLAVVGCNGPTEPLTPFTGSVTVAGKPVSGGVVVLHPDAGKGNTTRHEPRGEIKPNGEFEVYTAGRPGAPAGAYKVTVIVPGAPPKSQAKNPYARPTHVTKAEYTRPESTPLAVSVGEGSGPPVQLALNAR